MSMDVAGSLAYNGAVVKHNQQSVMAIKLAHQQEKQVVDLVAKGLEQSKANAPKPSGAKGQMVDISV